MNQIVMHQVLLQLIIPESGFFIMKLFGIEQLQLILLTRNEGNFFPTVLHIVIYGYHLQKRYLSNLACIFSYISDTARSDIQGRDFLLFPPQLLRMDIKIIYVLKYPSIINDSGRM